MLKQIELENFFSFGTTQSLNLNAGVNLLVGINGSGKSNLFKAISFLGEGMREGGSIQYFINKWGGFNDIANFSDQQKDSFRLKFEFDKEKVKQSIDGKGFLFPNNPIYEIEVFRVGATDFYLKERVYNKNTQDGKSDFIYLEMNNGRGFISERDSKKGTNQLKSYYNEPEETFNGRELVVKQVTDPKRYFPLLTLKRAIETLFVYSHFDTTVDSEIRQYKQDTGDGRLQSDGKNLFPIIQYISRNYTLEFDRLEEMIKQINPFFKGIRPDVQNGRLGLVLVEKNLSRTISIINISDGTLQFLLLMAIFFNPNRGKVICIDEPEKGLHPDMIRLIAEMMLHATKTNTQVIVATHNPLLLNSFDLDDLWLFEKDQQNQTIIKSKTEEEFEDWIDNFLPGDLWLRGLLGARRIA